MSDVISIIAPYSWLKSRVDRLYQSTEKAKEYEDSRSFLACIYFEVNDGVVTLQSESMVTTTCVSVDDLDTEGEGNFLVSAQDLKDAIAKMPHDSDIQIDYYGEDTDDFQRGEINLSTTSGDLVSFTIMDTPIESDAIPSTVNKLKKSLPRATVHVDELKRFYRLASSMAKQIDADQMAGQDPLSSCALTIKKEGVEMFSFFTSSSMFVVPSDKTENSSEKKKSTILTNISVTNSCIGTFSDNEMVDIAVDGDKMLYLCDEDTIMSINSINMGSANAGTNIDPILEQFSIMFPHAVVHMDINASTLFGALNRANPDKDEECMMEISGNEVILFTQKGKRTTFTQTAPAATTWLDDGERDVLIQIDVSSIKKTQGINLAEDNTVRCTIVFRDEDPWSMIIYNKDEFDSENPTNFFLISIAFS